MKSKILIILPNWLGDAVMATPAIEDLSNFYDDVEFTFLGSFVSIEALKHHPKCTNAIVDETKKASSRLKATYLLAKELSKHDVAITFRDQIHSSLLLYFSKIPTTIARKSWHSTIFVKKAVALSREMHLVKQYQQLSHSVTNSSEVSNLKLYIKPHIYDNPTLGVNAGATYGSAKRWDSKKFATVAQHFAPKYDIVIFGGPNEVEVSKEIEDVLKSNNIANYINLAGKTTISELCAYIGGLSLFATNDSGPMHIASAYQVPSVAIFGPTRDNETSQWKNKKSIIVKKDLQCAPCMKRECPLKHHECMEKILPFEVIKAINSISH
ncbi:MAG: lipopolysaccharide heptosyltransferase II [Campylobacterota bacterium]|nr:lipopolysaccharide heptosyltransferase II [Campylobacterota bacterium]